MFANFPLAIRTFAILVFAFCFLSLNLNAYAQTPQVLSPIGAIQTTTPKFSAVGSSLLPGVVYSVAISESPRGGTYGQYLDRWIKDGLTLENNTSGLVWSSNWQQRTRLNGDPDGPSVVVSESSPPTLTPGKTYYWHIVGDGGTYKSDEAIFTVADTQVSPPKITPNGGVFGQPTKISMTTSTPGATIYYSLDGMTPSMYTETYVAPITLNQSATIKAIAVKSEAKSSITSAKVELEIRQAPTISPGSGFFDTPPLITMSSEEEGASIYYTIDGTTPTTASRLYTRPFKVSSGSKKIKAIAYKFLWKVSPIRMVEYSTSSSVVAPVINPSGGVFGDSPTVIMTTPVTGASIYYTLDGTDPSKNSLLYSAPFSLQQSATIKAIAVKAGMTDSIVSNSTISLESNRPTINPDGGAISNVTLISLTSSPGTSIYYTTDGSVPSTGSKLYSTQFTLKNSATVKAIAVKSGWSNSVVQSVDFVVSSEPKVLSPVGIIQTTTPKFSAIGTSLLPGVTYSVVISESPRGGIYGQYLDRWVKDGLTLENNTSGLVWSSNWQQRTRLNGDPDGPPVVVSESSPPTLTPGKTYYWHIVGDNGSYKSEEASFTVGMVPSQPTLTVHPNRSRNLFEVSWASVPDVSHYELQRNGVIIYTGALHKQEVSIPAYDTAYTFTLKACNSIGCSIGSSALGIMSAQMQPKALTPLGTIQTTTPKFSAVGSSLLPGVAYSVVISESPRGGTYGQYLDRWVKDGLTPENNTSGLVWSSDWQQRTRLNGDPDGPPVVVSESSPPTLAPGKTYYWHIVGDNGTYKSEEASFTVANPPLQPVVIAPTGTIQTTTPRFAAVESSLAPDVVYGVAISESPRTGIYGQYVDWWVKTDLTANDLLEGNSSGLVWSSSWQQRTRAGNPDGPPFVVSNSSPLSLTPGKTYYWHIIGDNGIHKSEEASFTVDANAQPLVDDSGSFDFNASQNLRDLRFDLSWKPLVGHTRYELWRRSSLLLSDLYDESRWALYSISQAEYSAGRISIPFNSMPGDTYAQWKLVACDSANICSSQLSRVKIIRHTSTVTSTQLLSPSNNAVVDFDKTQNNLCFNWSADPNAVRYGVAVSDTPEFFERRWLQVVEKNVTSLCWGNVSNWTRTGVYRNELTDDLKFDRVYYWRVSADYADGREGFANTNQFTLNNSLPTLNVATDVITQSFKLEWNKVSNALFYQLQVSFGNTVTELESALPSNVTLPDQLVTTIDESMASYKEYALIQWQVRACQSDSNCGAWQKSPIKTNQYGSIVPGVSLLAPIRLASIDVAIDKTKPCFKWSSDSNATDYVVTISDTPEFNDRSWVKLVSGANTACWDNSNGWAPTGIYKDMLQDGLYRGFKYYWRVVSRYANGSLGFSQTYSFEVTDSSIPVIALLSPTPNESKRVFVGSNVPVMANVFDNYMRSWRNLDGRQPVVDYYINNTQLPKGFRVPAGTPVQWLANSEGTFKFKAVAYLDDAKTLKTLEAEVHVVTPQAPTLAIQTIGNVNAGSTIELNANVTDPDQQTARVIFYANGEPVGKTSEAPPYKTRWTPTVAGNYALTAKLIDKRSNETLSAVKNAVVNPSVFSTDGLNFVSDFGDVANQSWRVMPLEQSDVLAVSLANTSRISYNKLGKLLINRPLKIINRSDMYDNEIVPQLIVLDAGQIELNSSVEIVGEPADLLILNATVTNAIRCKNCGFINVERAVLAVATPVSPLSSAMTQVGQLQTRAAGVIDIDNLQASGAVSLEIIADRVMTKGHINTQQYARESTEVNPRNNNLVEPVLDFITTPEVNSVVVGSGGVSLLQGNLTVNYETLTLDNTVAGTGVTDLQGAISSGAINIFATDAIQLSGNLSTRSSHRAAQIYRGQLRAQDEQIQLKTIAQATTAPSLRIHGRVLSDAKVHMIGHSSEIKPDGGIRAAAVHVELIGQLLNQGYIHSYVRATSENPASDQVGIAIGAGTVDNRGEIQSMFNNAVGESSDTTPHGEIKIASVNDIYNRFGGLIKARKVNVVSEKGKIRNGSLYAFDGTAAGGKESTTAIKIAPHNTSVLSTHTALAFSASEPPVNNVTAFIIGDEVTLDAAQSVENINPYTEPYTSEAVEISATTIEAENRANDVQIEALKKLSIVSDTYVLNSSAKLGVSESRSGNLLSIKAPAIRNERYYSRMVMESFSDHEKVQEQTNIEISNWAKGVQSRYGFYSPPGYIYSFAKAEFDFGATGDGLLNNISYVDLYGDLKVFGKGQITTRGISLEKLAYESGSTRIVSLSECIYHERGRTCSLPSSTYSRTPEGKLIKQSPDNTLFAVNGEISAPANFFKARNDQSLTVLRQEEIAKYKEETMKEAIDYHKARGTAYIDSLCDVSSFDKEFESTIVIYQHFYSNDSNIKCFNQRAYAEDRDPGKGDPPSTSDNIFAYKNITDLVNEKIVLMGSTLNQQIDSYCAWRGTAQITGSCK